MQKTIFSNMLLASLFIGVVALAGISKASYSNPTSAYPNGNTNEPIDTSIKDQAKIGGLSVESFIARSSSQFNQNATINGVVRVGSVTDSETVLPVGTNTEVSGQLHTVDHLNSQLLKNSATSPKPVCADANGNIIFCN